MSHPRKIALFGGTFDPVHLGHIHLASLAREALLLDEVRFLPCRISPHKSGTHPADGAQRLAMLKIATASLQWAVVDDFELTNPGPSFSYLTAEAFARRFPSDRLFWIMGGDQWSALPDWRHPERLAACVEFIVLSRGESITPRPGYRLHVVHGEHDASASAIRTALAAGDPSHPWLAPALAEWILQKRLYLPTRPAAGETEQP